VNAEVVSQRELDLDELVSSQVVDRIADDTVDVDRADLVDQQPR
jgi:hypothetical protein